MEQSLTSANRSRRNSSRAGANSFSIYRRDSNLSTSSFLNDVEMAHDEVWISEPDGELYIGMLT